MLGKLIKYDIKESYKIIILLALLIQGTSILGIAYFLLPFWKDAFHAGYDTVNWQMFALFVMGFCWFSMFAFATSVGQYGVQILNGYSFYKSVYSNQGYLTHTLPVKTSHILFSKSLVGGVNMLIVTLVSTVNIFVIVGVAVLRLVGESIEASSPIETVKYLIGSMSEDISAVGVVIAGEVVVIYLFISFVATLLMGFFKVFLLYGSLSIGQLSRKFKLILGIVIYVAFLTVQGTFVSTVSSFVSVFAAIINPILGQLLAMAVMGVILLALGIVMLFVAKYIMENKLNLD